MKNLLALSCAVAICLNINVSHASDIKLPAKTGLYQNVSANHKTLSEAKVILEQLNAELKKTPPVQYQPALGSQDKTPAYDQIQELEDKKPTEADIKAALDGTFLISQEGDIEMQCGALSEEALTMRDIIYTTQEIKDNAKMKSHGIKAAGAIGSFLIGTATGGIGLAVGGFLLDQGVKNGGSKADELQDSAAQRRTLMMGIYNAKGCYGPLEHAMQNPDIFDPLSEIASIETQAGTDDTPSYNQ